MIVFDGKGIDCTQQTVDLALQKAQELNVSIVAASYSGFTAQALVKARDKAGADIPLIAVRGVFGFHTPNEFRMDQSVAQELEQAGVILVSAAHALSGAERGLSRKFQGIYPVEIIAHTLRAFGQGTKVCVECSTMALDAGVIPYDRPVVALAGTGKGADTCLLLTPAPSHDILAFRVHEYLCKPALR